jgi:predicted CXXCH cytochrome family protein
MKSDHAKDFCLECHSSEYITAEQHLKPALNTTTLGLTCPACHSVHNSKYTKLLRKPKKKLCESCHSMEGAKPGETPYHTQSEMRQSTGGVDADFYIYQPGASCVDCHLYTREYNQTGKHEDGITGHDFEINFNVCLKCHEGFPTAERAEKYVKNQQEELMKRYNQTLEKVRTAANITALKFGSEGELYSHVYNESLFNLQFVAADKSKGAHNPRYAMELIDKAEFKADNIIKGQPGKKMMYMPGFGLLAGLAALLMAVQWSRRMRR